MAIGISSATRQDSAQAPVGETTYPETGEENISIGGEKYISRWTAISSRDIAEALGYPELGVLLPSGVDNQPNEETAADDRLRDFIAARNDRIERRLSSEALEQMTRLMKFSYIVTAFKPGEIREIMSGVDVDEPTLAEFQRLLFMSGLVDVTNSDLEINLRSQGGLDSVVFCYRGSVVNRPANKGDYLTSGDIDIALPSQTWIGVIDKVVKSGADVHGDTSVVNSMRRRAVMQQIGHRDLTKLPGNVIKGVVPFLDITTTDNGDIEYYLRILGNEKERTALSDVLGGLIPIKTQAWAGSESLARDWVRFEGIVPGVLEGKQIKGRDLKGLLDSVDSDAWGIAYYDFAQDDAEGVLRKIVDVSTYGPQSDPGDFVRQIHSETPHFVRGESMSAVVCIRQSNGAYVFLHVDLEHQNEGNVSRKLELRKGCDRTIKITDAKLYLKLIAKTIAERDFPTDDLEISNLISDDLMDRARSDFSPGYSETIVISQDMIDACRDEPLLREKIRDSLEGLLDLLDRARVVIEEQVKIAGGQGGSTEKAVKTADIITQFFWRTGIFEIYRYQFLGPLSQRDVALAAIEPFDIDDPPSTELLLRILEKDNVDIAREAVAELFPKG